MEPLRSSNFEVNYNTATAMPDASIGMEIPEGIPFEENTSDWYL